MPSRAHEVLTKPDGHFTGGSKLTEDSPDGLMGLLKGVGERPPYIPVTESRDVEPSDEGSILLVDPSGGSITLNVEDTELLVVGFFTQIRQVSAGTVTIEAGDGVVINAHGSPGAFVLDGTWATVSLEKTGESVWFVVGQLA